MAKAYWRKWHFFLVFTDRHLEGLSRELQLKWKGSLRSVAPGQSVKSTPAESKGYPQLGGLGKGLQEGTSVSPKSLRFVLLGQAKVQQLVPEGDHPRCFWWFVNRPKHSSFSMLVLEINILQDCSLRCFFSHPLETLVFRRKRQASLMAGPGCREKEKARVVFAGLSEPRVCPTARESRSFPGC